MKIALVPPTHADLTFVIVDQKINALEGPIPAQLDNANVVTLMNAHRQKFVTLENAKVSN